MWFADVEYVVWKGNTKDLNFVHGAKVDEVILVDDHRDYVHPGQEAQWVEIACFDPSGEADDALTGTLTVLEEMLSAPTQYVPTPAP